MGLFDLGKNLIRNLTQTEVTEEMIKNAKSELLLDKKLSSNKYISLLLKGDYPKIIFGVQYLPSEDESRTKFNIPSEEKIVAFIRATDVGVNVFASENLIITDSALYSSSNKTSKRLEFDEIINRVLVCNGKDYKLDNVYTIKLSNPDDEFILMDKTIKLGASGIPEKSIMNFILEIIKKNKKERISFVKQVEQYVDNQVTDELLDSKSKELIEGLRISGESSQGVVDLLIHDAVVRCTTNLMMRFIARTDKDFTHIKEVIDYDISVLFSKLILSGADDTFFIKCRENLDKKANDIDLDGNQTDLLHFYDKCLGKITSTVAALSDKSLSIGKITSLANEYFDEKTVIVGKPKENDIVSAENADILGLTEKELFIQKSLVTKNEYLAVIYEKIKSGEEIERDDYFAVDGMGLTPLHYALMLKNFELAKKIINSTKDYSVVLEDIPEELEALYDYKTWVIQAGEDSLLDLLLERTEEIVVLRKTQAHIKRLLMVNKGFTAFGDYTISSGKSAAREARRRGDYDRYDDLSSRASDLNDKLDATKEKGRELQEQIDDIEREINEAKSRLRLFFRQQTNDLRKKSGFGKFVFDILEKPSLYEQILYGDYERVLFKYYGLYFYAKQDFSAWKEYKKEKAWQQNGRKNSSTNKKWFSDAAHNDLDVLTSEYRKLVVKYHPDNNPDGIEDFLLIQREREQILGKMKL